MVITVSGIHISKHPKLKKYAKEKVEKLEKFHKQIKKIEVRLILEKGHRGQENDYYCEIKISIPGHDLEIKDAERNFEKAVDKAVERMKTTLIRTKEKHLSLDHKQGIVRKMIERFRP